MSKLPEINKVGARFVEQVRQTLVDCVEQRVQSDGWLISDMSARGDLSKSQYMRTLQSGSSNLRTTAMVAFGAGFELTPDLAPRK